MIPFLSYSPSQIAAYALRTKRLRLTRSEVRSQFGVVLLFLFMAVLSFIMGIIYHGLGHLDINDLLITVAGLTAAAIAIYICRRLLNNGTKFAEIPIELSVEEFHTIIEDISKTYKLRLDGKSKNIIMVRSRLGHLITIVHDNKRVLVNSIRPDYRLGTPVTFLGGNRANERIIMEEMIVRIKHNSCKDSLE